MLSFAYFKTLPLCTLNRKNQRLLGRSIPKTEVTENRVIFEEKHKYQQPYQWKVLVESSPLILFTKVSSKNNQTYALPLVLPFIPKTGVSYYYVVHAHQVCKLNLQRVYKFGRVAFWNISDLQKWDKVLLRNDLWRKKAHNVRWSHRTISEAWKFDVELCQLERLNFPICIPYFERSDHRATHKKLISSPNHPDLSSLYRFSQSYERVNQSEHWCGSM